MNKILNKQENILNNVESVALRIIEDKLNDFFDSSIKNAIIYSNSLLNHSEDFSKSNYETIIISSKQIAILIQNIICEINSKKLNVLDASENINSNIEFNASMISLIKEYSFSLNITYKCQEIIDKIMSKALNLGSSNIILSSVVKKTNFGSYILGKNNYINMKSKYRKEIYNQIEGLLLNTKCSIKNQLTNYIIKKLSPNELRSSIEIINNKELMITA